MMTRREQQAVNRPTAGPSSGKKRRSRARKKAAEPSILFPQEDEIPASLVELSQSVEAVDDLEEGFPANELVEPAGTGPARIPGITQGLQYDQVIMEALSVCGLADQVAIKLAQALGTVEGIATMCQGDGSDFYKYITAFFKNNFKDMLVCNTTATMRIKAFGQFCKNLFRCGHLDLGVGVVTIDSLRLAAMQLVSEVDTLKAMSSVSRPPVIKLKDLGWIEWRKRFESYMRTQLGVNGGPLLYVIIDETFEVFTDQDRLIRDMYKARNEPQLKPCFMSDSHQVKTILTECLVNTEFDTLIDRQSDNGRDMWINLVIRCEGLHDTKVYLQEFVAGSKKLHYKCETMMTFNDYINKWEKLFYKASLAKMNLTDAQKIIWVTGNMHPDINTAMHQALTTVISRDEFEDDYHGMIYYFNNLIRGEKQASKQSRKRNVDNASTRKQGRFKATNDTSQNSDPKNKAAQIKKPTIGSGGVDVTKPDRRFSKDDWHKLPLEWKKYCLSVRKRKNKSESSNEVTKELSKVLSQISKVSSSL